MKKTDRPLVLVTNDDGINSPGLRAAIRAARRLGEVLVVAPAGQQTGAGRSFPEPGPKVPEERNLVVDGEPVAAYAIRGTPAQTVLYGWLVVAKRQVDLVISGINYGENIGVEITASGTVGAALEGAAAGIPSVAVSRATHKRFHFDPAEGMDFTAAEHFTEHFGRLLLEHAMPEDVDMLKIDVPDTATRETPWRVTRISRQRYFHPIPPGVWDRQSAVEVDYETRVDLETIEADSDVRAIAVDNVVSVTPLSLDMTARVDRDALEREWRAFGAQSTTQRNTL